MFRTLPGVPLRVLSAFRPEAHTSILEPVEALSLLLALVFSQWLLRLPLKPIFFPSQAPVLSCCIKNFLSSNVEV